MEKVVADLKVEVKGMKENRRCWEKLTKMEKNKKDVRELDIGIRKVEKQTKSLRGIKNRMC
jgi:hypothetical protein